MRLSENQTLQYYNQNAETFLISSMLMGSFHLYG